MRVNNPWWFTLDQSRDILYVGSVPNSNVQVFDAATCNAQVTSGCRQKPTGIPVGGWPGALSVDQKTNTVYVPDNVDGEVSFFRGRR